MAIKKTKYSNYKAVEQDVLRSRINVLFSSIMIISLFYGCGSQPSQIIELGPDPNPRLIRQFCTNGWISSSPAIAADGSIIFTSRDSSLYALKLDGTIQWKFRSEAEVITSSPVIGDDGTIYFGDRAGQLFAISPYGTLEWIFNTGESIRHAVAIGSDGTIYCVSVGTVYAISPGGELEWSFSKNRRFESPAISADGTIYVGASDTDLFIGNTTSVLHALTPDGSLRWEYLGIDGGSTPAIGNDGTIYITSGDSSLHAITPEGQPKWNYQTNSRLLSGASIGPDSTIYFGSWEYFIYAVKPDGSLKWKCELRKVTRSVPTVGSDGTIYVGCDSLVYAIDMNGIPIWQFKTRGLISTSSPALSSDGLLYVGSRDGCIYTLLTDSHSLANAAWPKFHANNQNTGRK